MPSFPVIAHAASRPAAAAAPAAAPGDADLFGQALNAASQSSTQGAALSPTLASLPPSRAQANPFANTGFDTPDSARAASPLLQSVSNAAQSAPVSTPQSPAALTIASIAPGLVLKTAGAATSATGSLPQTSTSPATPETVLQGAAANATASAAAAKTSLKQQAAALKAQVQAQPVPTVTAALAGVQMTLQNAPAQVSASTAAGVTDLLKQASGSVSGGPGAMQTHLANLTQQLNRLEARATGVEPSAPPQGWTEPPIFAQVRSLLNSLAGGTALTPAAMKSSGDPLAMAGLPIAGAPTTVPTTTAAGTTNAANATAQTTGAGVAQSAQTGQIAAALQAVQATQAASASQLDPQMLKAAAGQTPAPLSAPAQTTSAKDAPRATANDRGAPSVQTTAVADAAADAKTPAPATPIKDASGDNNVSLGGQVADQAAALAKDTKVDEAPPVAVASEAADAQAAQAQVQTQTASQTQLQAQIAAQTQAVQTTVDHGASQATAYLSAQMVKQLAGRSTQFDLQLHPADLGRVDVQMRIQQDGRLNAQLAFDNPAAAAEFRGRSDELRQQLQQAGFQLSDDSLTFTERNPQGFGQNQSGGQQSQSGWDQPDLRSRAFRNSEINAQTADLAASSASSRVVTGLDMRV